MKWKMQVQKLGRIQIPTAYLRSYGLDDGTEVNIEETKKELQLILTFRKTGDKK